MVTNFLNNKSIQNPIPKMANSDYTYDNIIATNSGYFKRDTRFSASVRRMQTKLTRLRYNCGTANGIFDENTENQVKAFQAANNLVADGYTGPQTLLKLDQLSPDSSDESYGRELTHSQLVNGYGSSSISDIEALARCIYG